MANMMQYRGKIQLPWRLEKRFIRDWEYRLAGVFECGVDFSGKTVLDAGCNVGIIAYEIAKKAPSFIHGMDNYRAGIYAARNIFLGVDIPSRFDVADLTNDRKLRKILQPAYDVVLFMSVWQHLRREYGEAAANRTTATLAERCVGAFVAQTKKTQASEFSALMKSLGFRIAYDCDPDGRLFVFVKA